METRRFCVYNQTSECFLSLGVASAETMRRQVKSIAPRHAERYDEGLWVEPSSGFQNFNPGVLAPLDLVYLDRNHQVVDVVESFNKFRTVPARADASSVLALPAHTIYSSQTQPGDQLVICVAEEMEFQLGIAPDIERTGEMTGFDLPLSNAHSLTTWFSSGAPEERRETPRQVWPRLVAHDWDGAELVVHGIRDASATGLYLLTEKRWPLGALVWMTLQRTDRAEDQSETSITVQMKVMRWGPDGVGLEFVLPDHLEPGQWTEQDRTLDEPQLNVLHGKGTGFIN